VNIRPGFPEKDYVELDGVKCLFHYAAEGGSSEEWNLVLEKESDGNYKCSIGSWKGRSYLFFKNFLASFDGYKITDHIVTDNNNAALSNIYDFDGYSIKQKPSWQGTISLLSLRTSLKDKIKQDLFLCPNTP